MATDQDMISCLRYELKESEEQRRKAAQHGLNLLESENVLQDRLDKLQNEIITITEVEKLKSELDEELFNEKQLKHKVDHLEDVIASKSEELHIMSERLQETMSSEMLSLQLELLTHEQGKKELQDKLCDLQYCKEQLELGNSKLTNRVARLEEEKNEKEKDLVSFYNSLQETREMNRDLQVQLDHALQQAQNFSSQGNSLFSEVEDRRVEMERQLISTKVKYQSLQKQHNFTREQLQRVKLQMAALLRMKGSQGEHDQLERLLSMLQQKNGQIEELLVNMKQLNRSVNVPENSRKLKLFNASEDAENDYYADLLQMKLENSEKEKDNLNNELSLQRMKALFESQRVLEMERKLFATEKQLAACQAENINLHVLLDELKIKYEPQELMGQPSNLQKNTRDGSSDGFNIPNSLCESSCLPYQNRELDEDTKADIKTTLQINPMNAVPLPPIEQRGRKTVKIEENDLDRTSTCKKIGNGAGLLQTTRLTSEPDLKIEENHLGTAEDISKHKKKTKKNVYPITYVSSKQNLENQCTSQ
ncbi:protein Spindly isoform X2 [Erythrolamprus reginae]|uniref:protein Spindly isoform X2 n=1 Tax=Erythrolamprus reginae TaxID=121349 RepID=UPI00396C6640